MTTPALVPDLPPRTTAVLRARFGFLVSTYTFGGVYVPDDGPTIDVEVKYYRDPLGAYDIPEDYNAGADPFLLPRIDTYINAEWEARILVPGWYFGRHPNTSPDAASQPYRVAQRGEVSIFRATSGLIAPVYLTNDIYGRGIVFQTFRGIPFKPVEQPPTPSPDPPGFQRVYDLGGRKDDLRVSYRRSM